MHLANVVIRPRSVNNLLLVFSSTQAPVGRLLLLVGSRTSPFVCLSTAYFQIFYGQMKTGNLDNI